MLRSIYILIILALIGDPSVCMARQIIDQAGRQVEIPDHPLRVVGLAPNVVEVVYLLGKGEVLKGATQYSNHPAEAALLPRVGSYVRLDIEKIVALKPDLCLATKDGNPVKAISRIEALGIPVYVVNPQSLVGIMSMVEQLGMILGADERAREIAGDMRQRIELVKIKLAGDIHRPGVFFQIDAAPIISAGSGTFIDELITTAGGVNLAAGPSPYPRFNWEDLIRMQPEVAIIASMAGGHSVDDLKRSWHKWPQLEVVKSQRLYVVDADLIDRPTPRLVDGLEKFAAIIHPELFGGDRSE